MRLALNSTPAFQIGSILLAIVAARPSHAFPLEPRIPSVDQVPEFAGLKQRWTAALDTLGVPGFSVAIVKDGRVIAMDAFGRRDLENHPVTTDTMFYIASCTKTYTAMGMLTLVESGKIDLNAPVQKYLPKFDMADHDLAASITVADLLCHRHGLNCSPIVHRDAYTGQITDEVYFRLMRDADAAGHVAYSNIHFTLAGRVIESASGQKWQDYLRDHVFEPAGMPRTTAYASVMYGDENSAIPMSFIDGQWRASPLKKTDRTMHAAGGMGTTAHDAARWLLLNMTDGTIDGKAIVSKELMTQMLTPQSTMLEPEGQIRVRQGFGYGWGTGLYRGRPYRFHGGGYIGTAAYMSFLPDQKIGAVILVNTDGPGQGMTDIVSIDIYDRLLGEKDQPDLLPKYEDRSKRMRDQMSVSGPDQAPAVGKLSLSSSAYTGNFADDTWGTIVLKAPEGDEMSIQAGDIAIVCRIAGDDSFTGTVAPGMDTNGRFVINDGVVQGVIIRMPGGGDVAFQRTP